MKRLIGLTLLVAAIGSVVSGSVTSATSKVPSATVAALPSWFGPARRMDLAARDKLTVNEFGCVAYDDNKQSDRPIRFVVNTAAAKRRAKAIIKKLSASSMTGLSLAKPMYSAESMLRLANSINYSKPEPSGTEQGWMYSAAVQSNEFDGTGCPRILISLLNTPTKAISDQTRAWANGVVQRYGASKVFIRESNTSQENPALPL